MGDDSSMVSGEVSTGVFVAIWGVSPTSTTEEEPSGPGSTGGLV